MPDTDNYPAEIECDEDGRYVVAFPDFGWGATDGATRDEALLEARDLLRELIAATIREGKNLPKPSRATQRRPIVVPPVPIALKAALYEAFRKAGVSKRRLARDLDEGDDQAALGDQRAEQPFQQVGLHRLDLRVDLCDARLGGKVGVDEGDMLFGQRLRSTSGRLSRSRADASTGNHRPYIVD